MERGPGLHAVERAQDVRQPPFADMVWIPARRFRMGSDGHYPEERPAHLVSVDGFGSIALRSRMRGSHSSSRRRVT